MIIATNLITKDGKLRRTIKTNHRVIEILDIDNINDKMMAVTYSYDTNVYETNLIQLHGNVSMFEVPDDYKYSGKTYQNGTIVRWFSKIEIPGDES